MLDFKLSGRQVETGKKSIFLIKKSKKSQKTAILDQKTIKNEISDLATRKFELMPPKEFGMAFWTPCGSSSILENRCFVLLIKTKNY